MQRVIHNLTAKQKRILAESGFLPEEIRKIDRAPTHPNFDSKVFQDMITSRRTWKDSMVLVGWKMPNIKQRLRAWYKANKDRSPFDFLKAEYKPPRMLTIDELERKLKTRRSVSKMFGTGYGKKRLKQAWEGGLQGIPRPPQGRK